MLWGVLRLRSGVGSSVRLYRAVVNGRAATWWLLCYGFWFGRLITAGRGVVMIDRRRSGRWLDEIGVGLMLDEFRSTMQRILVQLWLS